MHKITNRQQKRQGKDPEATNAILRMDSREPSGSVTKFVEWLTQSDINADKLSGLEICCGKGRNVIWLAQQGINMHGLDFANTAITEAKRRASDAGVSDKVQFITWDVTLPYPIVTETLDFTLDCFGSTDIESAQGRRASLKNMFDVLKPGGYLVVYLLSTDDEFHKKMIDKYPGPDEGSFIHPFTGKYEKAFSEEEVMEFYSAFDLKVLERIPKKEIFDDKTYDCRHIWAVFQKPKPSNN